MRTPLLWPWIVRAIGGAMSSDARDAALGDLLEDYGKQCARIGRVRAEIWLVAEARAMRRAYRARLPAPASGSRPTRFAGVGFDLRLGLRSFVRQPGLAVAIVGTVGLAIAANAALFSVFDGLLYRPLAFRDASRIVAIDVPRSLMREQGPAAWQTLNQAVAATPLLVEKAQVVPDISAFERGAETVDAWHVVPYTVTPQFFRLLGIAPYSGRAFTNDDEAAEPPRPVIIGEGLWRSHFGGDGGIIGTVVEIPGTTLNHRWTVVGIMPAGFDFPSGANFWTPLYRPRPAPAAYARLAPGVSIEQLRAAFPKVTFAPLREAMRPRGAFALAFLLGATSLLLLVAWVQVAALLFSRTAGRAREIGVRLALGASRVRLLRQFGAEAVVAGAAALGLAWLLTPALTTFVVARLPPAVTAGQSLQPDWRTFAFTSVASLFGIVLLALLPAEVVRRANPAALFRAGTIARTRLGALRIRSAMLVAQLALTAALVYMAGLALHSFRQVTSVDLGFSPEHVVAVPLPYMTVNQALGPNLRSDLVRQQNLHRQIVEIVRTMPGVVSAAGASGYPLQGADVMDQTVAAVADPQHQSFAVRSAYVTDGYVRTLGLHVVEGRDLQPQEAPDSALANRAMARELSRFGPVVGQTVTVGQVGPKTWRVVGIVADFVDERPDQIVRPELLEYSPDASMLIAKSEADPAAIASAIQSRIVTLWGDRPRPLAVHLEDAARRATADYRARSILLAAIALLCVPVAIAGLAGALGYLTRQRTRDIAIRLALGAEPGDVRRRVVLHALGLAAAGLAIGLAAGALIGRLMSGYLFGVGAADLPTVAAVAGVLLASAWFAAAVPARRAARIQPAATLREP